MRTAFIHDVGYLMQDAGYRMPVMDAGVTLIPQKNAILDVGCLMRDTGCRMPVMGVEVACVPLLFTMLDI